MTAQSRAKSRFTYRTIDIVTPVMIGVVFGVVFLGVSALYSALDPITKLYAPSAALMGGLWYLPALLGGIVVRKPGAALLAEILAASVEALLGGQWGPGTLISGVLQGIGVEIALVVVLYARANLPIAMLGGMISAVIEATYERFVYYPVFTAAHTVVFFVFHLASGAVLGGIVAWYLARALAAAGALNPFPLGREYAHRKATANAARRDAHGLAAASADTTSVGTTSGDGTTTDDTTTQDATTTGGESGASHGTKTSTGA